MYKSILILFILSNSCLAQISNSLCIISTKISGITNYQHGIVISRENDIIRVLTYNYIFESDKYHECEANWPAVKDGIKISGKRIRYNRELALCEFKCEEPDIKPIVFGECYYYKLWVYHYLNIALTPKLDKEYAVRDGYCVLGDYNAIRIKLKYTPTFSEGGGFVFNERNELLGTVSYREINKDYHPIKKAILGEFERPWYPPVYLDSISYRDIKIFIRD